MKLNLGCGKIKYKDFINIDAEPSVAPDLLLDFTKEPLPYSNSSVDVVAMVHVIEHIPKYKQDDVLHEVSRVLKPGGVLFLMYPEFVKCAQNYINNYRGKKEFWEATIYGRQLYPTDFHVALMDSEEFALRLRLAGFEDIEMKEESEVNNYNTIAIAYRGNSVQLREDVLRAEI